jgi:predicted phage terminase large subunit-like protein
VNPLDHVHPNALKAELARRHMLDFTTFTFPGYRVNWHHRTMCGALDRLCFGDLKRLMIFTPPRHGKSELVSRRLPAKFLGNNPDGEVILASYAADLANRMNTNVQQIMDGREYKSVFPHVRLPGAVGEPARKIAGMKRTRTNEYFEIVGHKGSLRSVGVGGGITGMGFNLGIIDDPVKDAEEAMSQVIRDKVWDWYTSTFWTRQTGFGARAPGGGDSDARILLTMTRWHDDDLAGRLLQLAAEDPEADQWEVISLPGLSTEDNLAPYDLRTGPDQALWEDSPYGLKFMHAAERNQPSYFFQAMYQQTPKRKGGGFFDRNKFGHFTLEGNTIFVPGRAPVAIQDCFIWAGVDLAASEDQKADFTVVVVMAQTPTGECLILQVYRERLPPNAIPGLLRRASRDWPIGFFAVESDGFQVAVVAVARRDFPGLPPIREVKHQGKGKLVRATKAIVRAENRELYVPKEADWKNKFFDELEVFTGEDDKHDDQVDALAHAVEQFGRTGVIEGGETELGGLKPTQDRAVGRESASARRGLWGRR